MKKYVMSEKRVCFLAGFLCSQLACFNFRLVLKTTFYSLAVLVRKIVLNSPLESHHHVISSIY